MSESDREKFIDEMRGRIQRRSAEIEASVQQRGPAALNEPMMIQLAYLVDVLGVEPDEALNTAATLGLNFMVIELSGAMGDECASVKMREPAAGLH